MNLSAMRALAIVHQPDAGPGVFGEALRERGVEVSEWYPAEAPAPPSDPFEFDAVLSFGGAMHPDQEAEHPWLVEEKRLLAELLDRGMPLLGVCLGAQLLGEAAGAWVRRSSTPEIGWYEVSVTEAGGRDRVIGPLSSRFEAFGWHSYEVALPPGATPLAGSETCLQAYRIGELAWGIQFHAEVSASDAADWIHGFESDPDAVRIGIDPDALLAETHPRLQAWNTLGHDLCSRFLDAVS